MQKFVQQSSIGIFRNERTRSTSLDPKLMFCGFSDRFVILNFGAKWAELVPLMHKFVQQSHVVIFHDERTRSTPFVSKLMFWGVSDRFVTAQILVQNGWAELVQ
jgi:hypothetical protein